MAIKIMLYAHKFCGAWFAFFPAAVKQLFRKMPILGAWSNAFDSQIFAFSSIYFGGDFRSCFIAICNIAIHVRESIDFSLAEELGPMLRSESSSSHFF